LNFIPALAKIEKMAEQFNFKIGGEAGFGIMVTGLIFSKTATRSGYNIFDYTEYPSLIRGGHNTYQVTVSKDEVSASPNKVDFLVALNQKASELHAKELNPGSGIIFDNKEFALKGPILRRAKKLYPIPLMLLAKKAGGTELMRNTVALGATLALLGGELSVLKGVIKDTFAGKKEEIIKINLKAALLGFDYAKDSFSPWGKVLTKREAEKQLVLTGNEAISLGAIAGGLKFFAAYPMTPASSILHVLAGKADEYGFVVKHAEDEIAVINMAIGAALAGARSMVATSGGGFSLMVESLGLAGITETGVVIVNAQRPGPATGMPTWTEQGDLRFMLHAAQGEFPRIVLAPGDVTEAFYLTAQALSLSEKYQTPVIILSDKFLSESHQSVSLFDGEKIKIERGKLIAGKEGYQRYQLAADGISPRVLPGEEKGLSLANSYEHDEYGYSTEESRMRTRMVDKRAEKLKTALADVPEPELYGSEEAKLTLVGWGSSKGPVREAIRQLSKKFKVNHLHLNWLSPLPTEAVGRILDQANKTLVVENNHDAQIAGWIRQETGIEIENRLLKYDGRPFYPEEIVKKVKDIYET
jgi:2-oxoglutarate ferredoxin oxidoreductase subunit alpha